MSKYLKIMALALAVGLAALPVWAEDGDAYKGDPYSLNVCAVTGEKLGSMGDPITLIHEGRDIKFCCAGCNPRFEANPAKYLAIIDAKMVEMQSKIYPLTTDVVTGEELPEEGAVDYVFQNRLFRLADSSSVAKLQKDPDTYFTKLDEAVVVAQLEKYPFDKCLVSGEELGGAPGTLVVANRLFAVCCDHCNASILAEPAKFIGKVDSGEMGEVEGSDHK